MPYSEKSLEHYNNPRNVGSFSQSDATVGTGLVGAPECGDVMKLQIKVNADTGLWRSRASTRARSPNSLSPTAPRTSRSAQSSPG